MRYVTVGVGFSGNLDLPVAIPRCAMHPHLNLLTRAKLPITRQDRKFESSVSCSLIELYYPLVLQICIDWYHELNAAFSGPDGISPAVKICILCKSGSNGSPSPLVCLWLHLRPANENVLSLSQDK